MPVQLEPWYGQTLDTEIDQGDIFQSLRLTQWQSGFAEKTIIQEFVIHVVVVSHSCDIISNTSQSGIPQVLVCLLVLETDEYKDTKQQEAHRKVFANFNNMVIGRVATKFALPPFVELKIKDNETNKESLIIPRAYADFTNLFLVPRAILLEAAKQPRPRMNPPYRQEFTQVFGRYFMRVEIPDPDPRRTG
jgi:hypothetical protein